MWVAYHKASTLSLVRQNGAMKLYKTPSAAIAAITRAENRGEIESKDYAVAELGDFQRNIEKSVERTNLMSGLKYMEPVNTPRYCSPSSDAYWD